MIIPTKYNVGHKFWVPRCRKVYHEEEKEIDGNIWVRSYFTYESYVKEKEIVFVEVQIGRAHV